MDPVEIKQMAVIEEGHWWFRERRALIARQLKRATPGRAIDIGAAAGRNTKVLEDIEDDAAVVDEMMRVLKPGGRVLIAVPADPRLWSEHDDAVSHLRRYTRESLTALFADAGFTIEKVASWNVLLRPAIAWKRGHPSNAGSDIEMVSAPLNRVLHAIVGM